MLAGLVRPLGERLRTVRPGVGMLTGSKLSGWLPFSIRLSSPAFSDGAAMPRRFTADGEGLFPPLRWERDSLPPGTQSLALVVEDADIPFVHPVAHAIVHGLRPEAGWLEEGEVPFRQVGRSDGGFACGRNFLARPGWTPPSPPPGHGPHRYAFQVFALRARPAFPYPPGRALLMRTITPLLLGQGRLIGTYERP